MNLKRFAVILPLVLLCLTSQSYAQLNKPTALVKGEVRTPDGKPLNGVVVQVYRNGEKINSSKTNEGKFQVVLSQAGEYKILCTEVSHYSIETPLSIAVLDKYQEIPVSISMKSLEIGSPYPFTAPVFEPRSSTLSPQVTGDLDNIAAQIKRNNKLKLSITVYPDEVPAGKKTAAQTDLANSRKNAIAGYFLGKGLNSMSVSITVSNSVPPGKFDRASVVAEDTKTAKGKKKAKKTTASAKTVKVPQTADLIMTLAS